MPAPYFIVDIIVRQPAKPAAQLAGYPEPPWSARWGDHAPSAGVACERALGWFRSAHPGVGAAGLEITAKPLRPDGFKI